MKCLGHHLQDDSGIGTCFRAVQGAVWGDFLRQLDTRVVELAGKGQRQIPGYMYCFSCVRSMGAVAIPEERSRGFGWHSKEDDCSSLANQRINKTQKRISSIEVNMSPFDKKIRLC